MSDERKAKRVQIVGRFVQCPFCGYLVHYGNPLAWCAGCFVRYRVSASGASVLFDPAMRARSEGEAWAIAIAKSGGARIG